MITKNGRTYMISRILLLLAITIASAYIGIRHIGRNSANELTRETHQKQFICSMHPEVIKDEPGDCSICGMSLVEKIDPSRLPTQKQFVCSMHPEVIKEGPGDCPICNMSLIEKIDHDSNVADSLLIDIVRSVNESVLASVATVYPVEEDRPVIIDTYGLINYDIRFVSTISARYRGLVEKSFVRYQFQPILKGQKIYEIYCPDIYTDKWNYIKLLQGYPDRDDLTVEAREWLKLLGLTPGQIDSLKRAVKPDYHLTVYSDVSGYAVRADFDPYTYFSAGINDEFKSGDNQGYKSSIGFNEGVTVEAGEPLFKIINLQSLRADLNVKIEDVGLLKIGQKVKFKDAGSSTPQFEGIISQIDPLNGGVFQLVKVYFKDPEGCMKPGRQIQGQILSGRHKSLWVPQSSIINMGQRQSVFELQNGRFIATPIKTGLRSMDKIEVLWGIDQNSAIASNALLLIDSDGFIP